MAGQRGGGGCDVKSIQRVAAGEMRWMVRMQVYATSRSAEGLKPGFANHIFCGATAVAAFVRRGKIALASE